MKTSTGIVFLALIGLALAQAPFKPDPVKCTTSISQIVQSLFSTIVDIEKTYQATTDDINSIF
jgi:hypothetical protein